MAISVLIKNIPKFCAVYLEELARTENLKIFLSSTHCKTYEGWQFPSAVGNHQGVYDRMIERTEQQIVEFMQDAEAPRKSDSNFISSDDDLDVDCSLDSYALHYMLEDP